MAGEDLKPPQSGGYQSYHAKDAEVLQRLSNQAQRTPSPQSTTNPSNSASRPGEWNWGPEDTTRFRERLAEAKIIPEEATSDEIKAKANERKRSDLDNANQKLTAEALASFLAEKGIPDSYLDALKEMGPVDRHYALYKLYSGLFSDEVKAEFETRLNNSQE